MFRVEDRIEKLSWPLSQLGCWTQVSFSMISQSSELRRGRKKFLPDRLLANPYSVRRIPSFLEHRWRNTYPEIALVPTGRGSHGNCLFRTITRKAIIRINQKRSIIERKILVTFWRSPSRSRLWNTSILARDNYLSMLSFKSRTCTYARHLTSCGIDPLLIYQQTTRQRSYILCLSATFAIAASPIMKLVLHLLCIVLHVSVLSTSARIFSWDNINYVYAFGDSYSFVQGTKGHANFRCVCVCVWERERNGQSFAKPS